MTEFIDYILDSLKAIFNLSSLGAVASIAALFWTAYISLQLRGIKKERIAERGKFREALNLDSIDETIRGVSALLETLEHDTAYFTRYSGEITEAKNELVRMEGEISGTLRTISKYFEPSSGQLPFVLVEGYYSSAFMLSVLEKAKRRVRIICVRTMRVTEPDFLALASTRINKGCKIEIYALSDKAPPQIIQQAMSTLPTPTPPNLVNYTRDMEHGRETLSVFAESIGNRRSNIEYYEYCCFPNIHIVQVDDDLYLGFQYLALLDNESPLRTMAIALPAKYPLGAAIATQIDFLQQHSDTVKVI